MSGNARPSGKAKSTRRRRAPTRSSRPPASARPQRKRPKRRPSRLKTGVWVVLAVAMGCLGAACSLLWLWGKEGGQPASQAQPYQVTILTSTEPEAVARQLEQEQLVSDPHAFVWYRQLFLSAATFEPGEHLVPSGASPRQLIQLLARHLNRPVRKVTIPEGYDSFQIAARLQQQGICPSHAFEAATLNSAEAQVDVRAQSYEGYLYPATYELRLNSDARDVRDKMVAQAKLRFEAVFKASQSSLRALDAELGFGEHEVIVLASIVEKERADLQEAGTIASVFLNRLKDPNFKPYRALQSDPTAGYGCRMRPTPPSCQGFAGAITPALLRDSSNRYNTYRHAGLPPGPIANPSADVVKQVLEAPDTDYLYFVLGAAGRHVFSRTFAQHRAAIGRSSAAE